MSIQPQHSGWLVPVARALASYGERVQVSERRRPETMAGFATVGTSAGIIEVRDGPIRWINVIANLALTPRSEDSFAVHYGVPDQRITGRYASITVRAKVRKSSWFFGRVEGVAWQAGRSRRDRPASGFARAIADRLNSDAILNGTVTSTGTGIHVAADPVVECWVLSTGYERQIWDAVPTQQLWSALRRVGDHLLEIPVPAALRGYRFSFPGGPWP